MLMKESVPPEPARRFFHWYCHPNFVEDLEGDLEELHEDRLRRMSQRRAQWHYVRDVLLLFRPSIIRSSTVLLSPNQHPAMFRNYFKTGLRNLLKYKSPVAYEEQWKKSTPKAA